MKVYIVTWGELMQGGSVEGVFATREAARRHAARLAEDRSMEQDEEDSWYMNGDWMAVTEHEVV